MPKRNGEYTGVSKSTFFRAVDFVLMSGLGSPKILIDQMNISMEEACKFLRIMEHYGIIAPSFLFNGYCVIMTRMQVQELLDDSPQAEYYENLLMHEMDDSDWNEENKRMLD